ncbi:MAG TPA: hypothetical protein VNH40_00055 [Gaiellaceae bacterium]|nr:hypothetical protein [Gaiellaceae bacterium]
MEAPPIDGPPPDALACDSVTNDWDTPTSYTDIYLGSQGTQCITGMRARADAIPITVTNAASVGRVVFLHDDDRSVLRDRMEGGGDVVLIPGDRAQFVYDLAAARWSPAPVSTN